MKNPNGYGTVTKLSGNRRMPWIVKEGKSGLQKPIGYAATRQEGLLLLAQYNATPWDIEADKVTLQEIFDLWIEKRAPKLGASNQAKLRSAYKHYRVLADQTYKTIKAYHVQDCIDNCGAGHATQAALKNLWSHLDKLALELDVIQSLRTADLLTTVRGTESTRTVFTDDEVDRLWDNLHIPWVDTILILLYTGFRFSEALALRIDDIDLEAGTMRGGIKTAAGRNRIVPIHSRILPLVQARCQAAKSGHLVENHLGESPSPTAYRKHWRRVMELLQMEHTPHECRHTFRSRLDSAGANKVCIDRIMGHKTGDVGERVYTHKTLNELKLNIELITN